MLKSQRFVACGAIAAIVCAAAAQFAPTCCKYIGTWPTEGNPDGACAGSSSQFCVTGSKSVGVSDPMAFKFGDPFTPSCWVVTLTGGAYFVHQDCALPPPPGAHYLITIPIPDGQCCYIVGNAANITFTLTPQSYQIPTCEGDCVSSPPGEN